MNYKPGDSFEVFTLQKAVSFFGNLQVWNCILTNTELIFRITIKKNDLFDYSIIPEQEFEINGEKYTVKKKLGFGTYGCVHSLVREKDFKEYALKFYLHHDDGERELRYYTRLNGIPNILKIYQHFRYYDNYGIIMEKMEEDIYRKKLDFLSIIIISKNILNTLAHMHERNIVHGDIKLQNILLDKKGNAFLCDFSNSYRKGVEMQEIGTIWFRSPENSIPNKEAYFIDFGTDIWAFGICFLAMFNNGEIPTYFCQNNPNRLYERISDQNKINLEIDNIFKEYKSYAEHEFIVSFTKKLLIVDANNRITSKDALQLISPTHVEEL